VFEVFPIIWGDLRGFSIGLSGLIFIGVGIGSTIGAVIAWWLSREYVGLMREYRGSPPPEPRLKGAIIAGPFFVVGIFFLGWTGAFVSVPWWVPAIATIVVGVSFSLIFITFLVSAYPGLRC
jgi:DHA1 family multidrug resistance protein-like MFS transporter